MYSFKKIKSLKGAIEVPGDKSITHRAVMFSSMATGTSKINKPLVSEDIKATINAMKALGVDISIVETPAGDKQFIISSAGYKKFKEPENIIDCLNSGTTTRLLMGILAPQNFLTFLTGDSSLRKRPMDRVIEPLGTLGGKIYGRDNNSKLPIVTTPSKMSPAHVTATCNSAQVKSAFILSAIQIDGNSSYIEPIQTRDHTERLLKDFGADISVNKNTITVNGNKPLSPIHYSIPGDFSSAAFFLGASFMFNNSDIIIKNVGLNGSRSKLLDVYNSLGASIKVLNSSSSSEPSGDLHITTSQLNGGIVDGDVIPIIIDEIPILAYSALFAKQPITIRDAKELRIKESDRINAIVYNLQAIGADIVELEDGLIINPLLPHQIKETATLKSFDDHRIAMCNILLGKRFGEAISIDNIDCVDVSFPGFIDAVDSLKVI